MAQELRQQLNDKITLSVHGREIYVNVWCFSSLRLSKTFSTKVLLAERKHRRPGASFVFALLHIFHWDICCGCGGRLNSLERCQTLVTLKLGIKAMKELCYFWKLLEVKVYRERLNEKCRELADLQLQLETLQAQSFLGAWQHGHYTEYIKWPKALWDEQKMQSIKTSAQFHPTKREAMQESKSRKLGSPRSFLSFNS